MVQQLREQGVNTPVLMLSAIANAADRVAGLRAGCDYYLPKPYAFAEVLARAEGPVRRADKARREAMLRVSDLTLATQARRASLAGHAIDLQHREFLLLEYFMRHVGQVVTRSMLLEAAWDYDFEPRGNIMHMHMHRLRRKIDDGFERPLIRTIPGAGYMLGGGETL